jgi:hypothetical protein
MTRLIYILFLSTLIISCSKNETPNNTMAEYTYGVKSWETLGSQTLVILDAENPSHITQDITFKVEVINTKGKRFIKDTTIHFNREESAKDFQLLIDTEGEVEKVKVSAL